MQGKFNLIWLKASKKSGQTFNFVGTTWWIKFLSSLEDFNSFTRDLVDFYKCNNITPVIETDFTSSDKLNSVYSFFDDER